ncbi:hypothetical protein HN51_022961 [Arachis hypogaea]|uniref:CBL-interacting serine/threonine-protein kinase 11 n=1 Tax=Arachis hypogaea TaxID=3818 RepID=UPI000DEC5DFF|nr:CBL-interacting serine/threonine-protein kinase 11 [Arachis hypogaea]
MPGTQNNTFMEASASNGVVLFGKYEILELAGVGASAKVYHARRVDTGESVAVKAVSKRQLSTRDGYAEQIEREISIMRRMHHPHTVRLFEVLATKAKIYYVMEYAAGGELLRRVSSAGRMTENLARRYFQQLISAVAYCHSHGVFHRDLKLENLLVDENMDLKVTDFGLSAGRSQFGPDGLLHTICGTPAYVAPEILAKKGYRGGSVDIWSCGVILFTIVAGYLPFNDYNITLLYRKIYRGQFRYPKWVSCDFKRFVSRLLDRDPETRITIDEILKDPWFCRGGYKYPTRVVPELDEDHVMLKDLNAFDLISFSSGFDISGLLTHSEYLNCVERFVSKEEPESILERVKIMGAKMERVRVEKDENACAGVRLEGLDGNYVIAVRIYRLMNELVVIEVKRKEKKVGGGNFWRTRLKPLLLELALR